MAIIKNGDVIKVDGMTITKVQEVKDTKNKPNWSLVSLKGFENVVKVREFGVKKYKDPENWKKVDPVDYLNAIKRHITEIDEKGLFSVDEESGLPHLAHIACNAYFLDYFERKSHE